MEESILQAGLFAMLLAATEGVFTAPSLENLLTLATGWLLCRTRRTTTGLIVAARAVGRKHFGCFHRFFSDALWNTQQLWLGILRVLVQQLCPVGQMVLIGDDTVQGKAGRKISGASNWRNGCGSTRQQYRFLWGLNLVILGVAVHFCGKCFCLPAGLRIYRKKADCEAEGRPYRTRSELMPEMVLELLKAFPERAIVLLVDGQFATTKLLRDLPRRLTVITRLRRDAAIWQVPRATLGGRKMGRPRLKGRRLPTPERIATRGPRPWRTTLQERDVKTVVALWYEVTKTRAVRIVVVRQDNPREPYGYFLCTNPTWDADAILSTYACRWSIEITIRDAKQHGGPGDAQCRLSRAVERQHAFTLAMMALVMGWYIHEGHHSDRSGMRPWYRHKRGPTFLDMLTHARRQSLAQRVFGNSARGPDIAINPQDLLYYLEAAA